MGDKINIKVNTPDGIQEKRGEIIEIKSSNEAWSEYVLENGHKIKVKQIITQVVKLEENDKVGNPEYVVQTAPLMSVIPVANDGKNN